MLIPPLKKTLMIGLSLLTVLGGRSPKNREQNFWNWFTNHEDSLFHFENDQERVFGELTVELRKVNPDLVFEFSSIENGRRDFTISAGGIKSAFPAVEALYAVAPKLPRWKFFKFRQRHEPANLSYNGVTVSVDKVKFDLKRTGEKADITIFLPEYSKAQEETYMGIAFLLLDQSLGEYDVETRIGFVDVKNISEVSSDSQPFVSLPKTFDAIFVRH